MPFDTDISGALARKDYDNWLAGKGESYDTFLASLQKKARDGKYGTWVFAIDDSYVEDYNKTHDHAIDLNAFRRGEIVILGYGEEAAFHEMIGKKDYADGRPLKPAKGSCYRRHILLSGLLFCRHLQNARRSGRPICQQGLHGAV